MEKMSLSFKGMTNVPDDGVARDGEMAILVNMRNRGGELVRTAYPSKENTQIQGGVKKAKWHGDRLLELRADGALRVAGTETYINNGFAVKDFEVMGNIVVMYTEDNVLYSIYRNKEYVFLGELPDVPEMTMTLKRYRMWVSTSPDKFYRVPGQAKKDGKPDLYNAVVSKGYLDQCLDVLYGRGAYVDRAEYRLALRLFDGSYVSYSPIYYANDFGIYDKSKDAQGGVGNFAWYPLEDETLTPYRASVLGFIPSFTLARYDLSKWENIIIGVCLFSTGSLPLHKAKNKVTNGISSEEYSMKEQREIMNDMVESPFFLIAEYDLKGNVIKRVDNTSPSFLATQERLPDYNNAHKLLSGRSMLYNSRLHIANAGKMLHRGYAGISYFNYEGNGTDVKKVITVTHLMTENGELKVSQTLNSSFEQFSAPNISALLTYPDARAYKMEVYVQKKELTNGGSLTRYSLYHHSFDLIKHTAQDMAYFLYSLYGNIYDVSIAHSLSYGVEIISKGDILELFDSEPGSYEVVYNNMDSELKWRFKRGELWEEFPANLVDIKGTPSEGDSFNVRIVNSRTNPTDGFPYTEFENIVNENEVFHDANVVWETLRDGAKSVKDFSVNITTVVDGGIDNVLRVSAVDNPFFFPTAQTYKFEGEIVGMASNAEAVSTGQFGQYPLFVFTTDGIWAMGVDTSGRGAYVSQAPFAREICNGGVCPVSGGVVFTTDAGVMAISGGQVVKLSTALDGERPLMSDCSIYEHIFRRAGIPPVKPVRFRDYLKNARLGYDFLYKEVFLFNPDYAYSYVYSLESQSWYVRDVKLEYAVLGGKDLIVYGDYWRYTFAEGVNSGPVVAITRPVKAGTNDYKRLWQAALRCTFKGNFSFYVLGSNDGADFVCITGKEYPSMNGNEPTDVMRRDLVTSMSRSKQYKYFAIAFAGNMEGRVSLAELLVDMGFANNKIR